MRPPTEVAEQIEGRRIRPVDVLEHHDGGRRPPHEARDERHEDLVARSPGSEQRLELLTELGRHVEQRSQRSRRAERLACAPQERRRLGLTRRQRFNQRRLADTGLAGDGRELSLRSRRRQRSRHRSQRFITLEQDRHLAFRT